MPVPPCPISADEHPLHDASSLVAARATAGSGGKSTVRWTPPGRGPAAPPRPRPLAPDRPARRRPCHAEVAGPSPAVVLAQREGPAGGLGDRVTRRVPRLRPEADRTGGVVEARVAGGGGEAAVLVARGRD